ncbi:hypothetical protein H5410_026926 [Solanum commersonii]|uniref:Uncharacterized protein n=1 Tax=Solanum commersonii TaxID=4109 RepID=A0A9J5YYF0_SOLCO|nr:hypothetical protein H5410_026926 [Solanum commersonii]
MEHAKSSVRETHEHGYAVLNAYRYMLEVANPRSNKTLSLNENGRFMYFFVSYVAWIIGFQEMRKVIVVDRTFLRRKYEGVLLSAVAQDAEKQIFPNVMPHMNIFVQIIRSFIDDADELCIISNRHPTTKEYDRCEFNDHFNRIIDLIPKATETIERIRFHTWSRAFCPGNRRFALLFHQRRMELVNSANRFVPSIEKDISKYVNTGNKLLAHQIVNYKFSVTGHGDVATMDL